MPKAVDTPSNPDPVHVAKLGGSLLDFPDAVDRFESWRAAEMGTRGVLVVGGGNTADVVRDVDARFKLGQAQSHWLAIRAMQFNAHLLAAILPESRLVSSVVEAQEAWNKGLLAVVEPFEWLKAEELRDPGLAIPHRWSFTSDSIAAHIASHWPSDHGVKLTLLKSTLPSQIEPAALPDEEPIARAIRLEVVDSEFGVAVAALESIQLINLRTGSPLTHSLARDVLR